MAKDDDEWDDDYLKDDEEEKFFNDANAQGKVGIKDILTKKRLIVGGSVLLAIIIFYSSITWFRSQFEPPGPQGPEVTLQVPSGSSISAFASTLEKNKVVPSAFGMKLYLKFHHAPKLQAGEYVFHSNSSPAEALNDIAEGPKQAADSLTIPEGFRLDQIAQAVGRIPGMSAEKFTQIALSGQIRSQFEPANATSLEGYLFPDTYFLSSRDTETTLVQRMVDQFDNTARALGLDRSARSIGHSQYETVIIASMIESEAKVDEDRGKISQVIENRLNKAMPLQIDATLLYGLHNTKQSLSTKDLKTPGPYNTYLNKGLPPTPISNPGRASLQAALAPTPGPWLYYVVSDADGHHAFATTLDEHNKNVADARAKGLL